MFNTKLFSTLFVSITLIGCGGGSGKSKPTTAPTPVNPKATTSLKSFSAKESSINANIKSGVFNLSWQVTSSDPYEVDIYVSSDPFLSDTKDIRIFGQYCGSSAFYRCNTKGSFSCNFRTDNKIICSNSDTGKELVDISPLLMNLPQTAYMIIEACNKAYTSCKVKSQKVQFQ